MDQKQSMYTATFMIKVNKYDDEFHELNNKVIDAAESNPGYLGRESWVDEERNVVILYWDNLSDLKDFSNHPDHLVAKKRYEEWYGGYQVLISEVVRSYGDGNYDGAFNVPNRR